MRLLLLYLERRGWIIGMEVKYDAKMLAKLALIFFGLLFLVCVWLGRKTAVKEAPEGEQITAEDAVILLEALEGADIDLSFLRRRPQREHTCPTDSIWRSCPLSARKRWDCPITGTAMRRIIRF